MVDYIGDGSFGCSEYASRRKNCLEIDPKEKIITDENYPIQVLMK
jgi:hypothetical protein